MTDGERYKIPNEEGLATVLTPLAPGALLALPPLVGVTDFEIGVVGFSPSIFFVDGVLAFDEVPLLGLHPNTKNSNVNNSGELFYTSIL